MRLWIVLSVLWAVIIVGMFGLLIAQTYQDPDRPSVYYQLSDSAKSFYENSKEGEGPTYEATVHYADGTSTTIEFPLLTSTDFQEFETKVKGYAEGQGTHVHPAELDRFYSAVIQKNKDAEAASLEYRRALALESAKQRLNRATWVKTGFLVLFIPPLAILSFGYAIAWVRRGFQTAS